MNLRVQISWQAQHFAACQGVGCTPWRRLGTGAGCADFVAGAALCEPSCADFVAGAVLCEPPCADLVAGAALCEPPCAACQGVGCAPWRRLGTGTLPVAFACCVRRLLLAKESDVRPGVGWAPALPVAFACCVRRLLLAKGSDVRPGVGWAPALDVQISWQAQHFVNLHVQISWQAQYFVNLRVQISWQAQHFVNLHVQLAKGSVRRLLLAQGSDVRPGVGWAPALDVHLDAL